MVIMIIESPLPENPFFWQLIIQLNPSMDTYLHAQ